jgi:hypothetical protein
MKVILILGLDIPVVGGLFGGSCGMVGLHGSKKWRGLICGNRHIGNEGSFPASDLAYRNPSRRVLVT